jgi:hypothetical protein
MSTRSPADEKTIFKLEKNKKNVAKRKNSKWLLNLRWL